MTAAANLPLSKIEAAAWHECRFATCSVLPVRVACNLTCPFCFSKSSVSALRDEPVAWDRMPVADYYAFARDRGATRLVITGGGEPLLRAPAAIELIRLGRTFFDEIACFTNGTFLSKDVASQLAGAGLGYVCYSRHHWDDAANRALMGAQAPDADTVLRNAGDLPVRATCVMTKGFVDSREKALLYMEALGRFGVREFTFKHTYVAYADSMFQSSQEDRWARRHRVDADPFEDDGETVATLPWGPRIRKLHHRGKEYQVCFYHEPTPRWELQHRHCRSSNLLSDGRVYASLEDARSLLFQLPRC